MVPVLRRLLKRPVLFVPGPITDTKTIRAVHTLASGSVALLENIRFDRREEKNNPVFARALARLGDMYVNDAFANAHRAHASVAAVTAFLPSYAGLLLQKEFTALTKLRQRPAKPYVAIIGGAKISTKLGLVRSLLQQADHVLLGGALANTVLQAEGQAIGASLSEPKMLRAARGLTVSNPKLEIPVDVIVARHATPHVPTIRRAVANVGPKEIILDIGPDTVAMFSHIISQAKTVVWNGPMGKYEIPPFSRGSKAMAKAMAKNIGVTVAGGGETLDAIAATKTAQRFTFLSTGGGAMLEFLEGKKLPGLQAVAVKGSI